MEGDPLSGCSDALSPWLFARGSEPSPAPDFLHLRR